MASLSNHLEGLNLDKKRESGAIPKSASVGCVPGTGPNAPSTPSSNPKNRRNRRNRQKNRQNNTRNPSSSSHLLQPSPSASELTSTLSSDRRVPEIPELPELLPLLEQCSSTKVSEEAESKPGNSATVKNNGIFGSQPENIDSPKVTNKKAGSRRNRKSGAGKRKKPAEDGLLNTENRKDRGKGTENKENSKAFNEDFPHIQDSDLESDADDGAPYSSDEPKYIWRNVTRNGMIKKCVLVDGIMEGGRPKPGDAVLVKSQGKLKDGRIIDDEPSMVFNIGDYEVIEGLDLVVQSMYKNELSIVSIKPEMAYGSLGRSKAVNGKLEEVPADARITYLFGLLHFEKAKDMSTLTWAQRRKSGQSRMRLANWWYQRKEYPIAVKCYKKALQYYNDIPTNQECSSPEEYKELLQLMEERLRVMRQVANIFKRIANFIQSGQIEV